MADRRPDAAALGQGAPIRRQKAHPTTKSAVKAGSTCKRAQQLVEGSVRLAAKLTLS